MKSKPCTLIGILAGMFFVGAGNLPASDSLLGFQLQDHRGAVRTGKELAGKKATVICFLGTECPLAGFYADRAADLAKKFESQGVAFVGIDSNSQDSLASIATFVKSHELPFLILKDPGSIWADRFQATRTPEFFVLDAAGVIRYHGRFDDQMGIGFKRPSATRQDLEIALAETLAGKTVAVAKTKLEGCKIGRVRPAKSATISFSKQIAPILQAHCVECHREGQLAPFAMTDYATIAGWAETIKEVVEDRRMPPWHANPKPQKYRNDPSLSANEIELIAKWVDEGAPAGGGQMLPAPKQFPAGWRIPQPDVVVEMPRSFQVPATGEVDYQYFVADPHFTEDKWIRAAEAVPGNPKVVHHIIVMVKPPPSRNKTKTPGLDADWLVATAPGARPLLLDAGQAKFIPAGSQLIFQMHYTPNGKPATDRSKVGLVFADPSSVKKEIITTKAHNEWFVLQPGKGHQVVSASRKLADASIVYAFFPHMHLRGKAFKYEAVFPSGAREVLLDVPNYDFAWQNAYELAEPKLMPAGTTIECTAEFDNSPANRSNPNPKAFVKWGDQTWEEMMIGYFSMALADQDLQVSRVRRFQEAIAKEPLMLTPPIAALAQKLVHEKSNLDPLLVKLRERIPQLDRIDVMVLEAGSIRIPLASQQGTSGVLRSLKYFNVKNNAPKFGKIGEKAQLATIIESRKLEVTQDLGANPMWDQRLLRRSFGSAVHVPMEHNGKPAMVNFWSRDVDAFPKEATTFFEALVTATQKTDG